LSASHLPSEPVARENEEVRPRDLAAVFLLDRPEQPARLVEADVVGPAIERREALLAAAGTAPAVADPIRPGAVSGHADEERPKRAKLPGKIIRQVND
jgi:hypothetical protein